METGTSYPTAPDTRQCCYLCKAEAPLHRYRFWYSANGPLQGIRKEVSLKHTGIKQEPYSAPVHDTHPNHLEQNISQLQTDIQSLKDAITHPILNMLHSWITTLLISNNSYLRWKRTSNTCSRWNALMSTPFLLENTEVFEPLMV